MERATLYAARFEMGEPGAVREDDVRTTDDTVQTADDTVQTPGDTIETEATILAPDIVTLERAARLLEDTFGPLVDADYLGGKTMLCDVLAAHFGISILTAEELCDELERAERIRFVHTEDGAAWHIHSELV
jgi:hypothetical protein